MSQRLFHPDNDVIMQSTTVLTTTGTLSTFPVGFLQDQLRQKPVRWGRYVVDEHNDKIDFNRAGVKVATLTHGTYDTPADYATMVEGRLLAADGGVGWTLEYGVAAPGTFRLYDGNGFPINFALLFSSGANKARSAAIDLGFAETDVSGTTTYTAGAASYQSRKFLVISSQSGTALPATAAWILEHTATQTGASSVRSKVTIQGNATDDWSAPSFSEDFDELSNVNALDDPNVPCIQYFTTGQTRAFFRLILDDVQHDISYTEVGRFGLGTYSTVSICVSDDIQFAPEDFSTGSTGPDGPEFWSYRRRREVLSFGWKQANAADHAVLLRYFKSIPTGRQWLFDFEVGNLELAFYGSYNVPPGRAFVPTDYWDWTAQFREAL